MADEEGMSRSGAQTANTRWRQRRVQRNEPILGHENVRFWFSILISLNSGSDDVRLSK
jgi:hypothetical protein